MSVVSKEIYEFLKAYAQWAYTDGAPEHKIFRRAAGLCINAAHYGIEIAYVKFADIFTSEGLDGVSPFGDGTSNETLNPRRKAWVLKTIKEYENANNVW